MQSADEERLTKELVHSILRERNRLRARFLRILLTGASGFVGRVFRRLIPSEALEIRGQELDVRRLDEVKSALQQSLPDAIVHLAAQSFVPESFSDPITTIAINFVGTLNLLLALKEAKFRGKFLFVGSGDVYGKVAPENLPIVEEQPLKPRSPYGVSKVAAEAACFQWSQTESFQLVMARPFNHIGAGQSARFVISDFAKQLIEIKKGMKEPVIRTGDIDVTRDFLDVRDVVRAYVALLTRGENGEVYNVCSGVERSVRTILGRMMEISGVKPTIVQEPGRFRLSEQKRVVGSPAKLRKHTSWAETISIDESLEAILNYWEQEIKCESGH